MDEINRATFLLWSETDEYKRHIYDVNNDVRTALEMYDKPYVAFSGGKDSSVMLSLVIKQDPNIMIFHWDYGRYYIPREMEHSFIDNAMKMGAKNIRVRTSKLYEREKRDAQNVLGRIMLGYAVPGLRKEGFNACFLGLRKEESCKRKRRINGLFEFGEITNVFPVMNLTWKDVYAYIVANNLPYPSFYDERAKIFGYDQVRLVTFFDPEFEKLGSIYES